VQGPDFWPTPCTYIHTYIHTYKVGVCFQVAYYLRICLERLGEITSTNRSTMTFPTSCKCYFSAREDRERSLIFYFTFRLRLLSLWIPTGSMKLTINAAALKSYSLFDWSIPTRRLWTIWWNYIPCNITTDKMEPANTPHPIKFTRSKARTDYPKLSCFFVRIPAMTDWNKGPPVPISDCSTMKRKPLL
jgi:hypothetical protein